MKKCFSCSSFINLRNIAVLALVLGSLLLSPAYAAHGLYTSTLNGAQVVPPNGSTGTATGSLILTGTAISCSVTWSGLNESASPVRIHQGAPGVNGPVIATLQGVAYIPENPPVPPYFSCLPGATLTAAQIIDLDLGNLYFSAPTAGFPGGEIRGQILHAPLVCYTAPSATGSGSVNACFTGGGSTCSYSAPQFIGAPPSVAPIPPTTPGPGIVFPHGLFDFSTSGCLAGNTLSFSITYPAALPPGTQYWKYGSTAANTTPHWYVLPATISGNTATFSITDGGLGDDDLVANGTIVDQGGPGAGSSSNSVPTLSEWAMGLLALLMLLTVAARRYGARGEVRRVG